MEYYIYLMGVCITVIVVRGITFLQWLIKFITYLIIPDDKMEAMDKTSVGKKYASHLNKNLSSRGNKDNE